MVFLNINRGFESELFLFNHVLIETLFLFNRVLRRGTVEWNGCEARRVVIRLSGLGFFISKVGLTDIRLSSVSL